MPSLTDYTYGQGRVSTTFYTQITRSMTSNQQTGLILPAGFVVTEVAVFGQVASDAGGSATISVGSTNSTTGVFVSAFNVKTNGVGQSIPSSSTILGVQLPSPTYVTGSYNETGTASTAGGPWTVAIRGISI